MVHKLTSSELQPFIQIITILVLQIVIANIIFISHVEYDEIRVRLQVTVSLKFHNAYNG